MFRNSNKDKKKASKPSENPLEHQELTQSLDENAEKLVQIFGERSDLHFRKMSVQDAPRAAVLYLESLIDEVILDQFVMREILHRIEASDSHSIDTDAVHLSTNKLERVDTVGKAQEYLLQGYCLILLDQQSHAIAAATGGGDRRPVTESPVETVVRGPREAFNETLITNIGLVRRRLQSGNLKVEIMKVGEYGKTPLAILSIEGLVQDGIVEEVRNRLKKIEIDGVLDTLYLEEMIEDPNGYTPFPTIFNSERPDRIAAGLLEGRVAIMLEGTPVSLLVPATIGMFLTSNEDYYQRYDISSFLKMLRAIAFFISLTLPGFYVSLLTFHQEMIPTPLLIALTGQREGVPFGIAIELAFMEFTFEILREAGLRLPKTIGAAVSIVGGLVLGQAAVEAGLVAQSTVIAVSLTAIASFTTPSYNFAISARLLRFVLLLLSAILGISGLIFGLIFIYVHLNTLRSFSVPYLSPIEPFQKAGWKDLFLRVPWGRMNRRPEEVVGLNQDRMPRSDSHQKERKE